MEHGLAVTGARFFLKLVRDPKALIGSYTISGICLSGIVYFCVQRESYKAELDMARVQVDSYKSQVEKAREERDVFKAHVENIKQERDTAKEKLSMLKEEMEGLRADCPVAVDRVPEGRKLPPYWTMKTLIIRIRTLEQRADEMERAAILRSGAYRNR